MDNDYATSQRLAIYLEMSWPDYLFDYQPPGQHRHDYPNPLTDRPSPRFFRSTIDLAHRWAANAGIDIRSVCDIGGGTGRALHEAAQRFPDLQQLTLVEPSQRFCEWAERLLSSSEKLPEIPILGAAGTINVSTPVGRPPPLRDAQTRLRIVRQNLETFLPEQTYYLLLCLNVLDRHPHPRATVAQFKRLLSPAGLLVVATPYDFHIQVTPDQTEWITEMRELFADQNWNILGDGELYYEFRLYHRNWTRYSSQVIGVRYTAS